LALKKKILYFHATPKNIVIFAVTYVSEILRLLYRDFGMDSYSTDSDEAMKQGNEALHASSLKFFRRVKCFITSLLQNFTQRLTLHCRYFLKRIFV
jgi:hypothetical protein